MIKNNLVVLFAVCIVAVIFSQIMISIESAKREKQQPDPVVYSAEISASRIGEYAYLEDHLYVKTDSLCYPNLYCWVHILDDCKGCNRAKK